MRKPALMHTNAVNVFSVIHANMSDTCIVVYGNLLPVSFDPYTLNSSGLSFLILPVVFHRLCITQQITFIGHIV